MKKQAGSLFYVFLFGSLLLTSLRFLVTRAKLVSGIQLLRVACKVRTLAVHPFISEIFHVAEVVRS